MKIRALAAALALSAPVSLAALAPAEAAAPSLSVTWPEAVRFNPDTTEYVVDVQVDEAAEVHLVMDQYWGYGFEDIVVTGSGPVTLDFPGDGAWGLSVTACLQGDCSSSQRTVEVQRDLDVQAGLGDRIAGPRRDARIFVGVGELSFEGIVEVAWTLSPQGQPEVTAASGSSTLPQQYELARIPDLRLPEGSPDGTYRLQVGLRMQTADFGLLEGSLTTSIRWDSQAPDPVGFKLSDTVFYPVDDGYRDSVRVKLDRGGRSGNDLSVVVRDASGVEVRRARVFRGFTFDGRDGKRVLPAGRYTVELTTTDAAGNSSSTSRQVTLRPEERFWQEVGRTFKASQLLVERFVGRCGSLVTSPRGQRKGSLGYCSDSRCADSSQGTVSTVLGVTLPTAFQGRYRSFRVTVVGGAARKPRRSFAQLSYYLPGSEDYGYGRTLTREQGAHRGRKVEDARAVVVAPKKSPSAYWSIGVAGGAWYDIRSFKVEMQRQVLAVPGSSRTMSRTASEARTIAEPSGAPGPG